MTNQHHPVVNITGDKVAFGPLTRDLIPTYHRWHNDFAVLRSLMLPPKPLSLEEFGRWYEHWTERAEDAWFTIYDRPTLGAIGVAALDGIDYRHRTAEVHMLIGEAAFRGKGYGTETAQLLLDYAFTALGLHSLMLTVAEFNLAGIRAYQKAGFRELGRRRQSRMMGGKLWDTVYMDCLASEFTSTTLTTTFRPDEAQR